jgi:threonine-phosphate decarboxylase
MSHSYEHGGNVFSVARQMGVSPADTADFSASINPLGISPLVRQSIIDALDSLVHYPDNNQTELKQLLAEINGLTPEHFAIANGSTEIIYNLPALMTGRRAMIVSPAFSEYAYALEQHGWEVSRFLVSPADNFSIDLEALRRALLEGCDALYLCNPGNPSGILYPRRTVEQVYDLCREAGTFLVLDEAFMDFCEEASAKDAIVSSSDGIVLRSMTKFYGIPGLRLGYAMAAPSIIERLSAMGGPWSVNTLAQVAGVAALRDTEYSRRTISYVEQERAFLKEQLAGFPGLKVYPSSANFLLIEIDGAMTSTELKQRLIQKWILIRDCANFKGLSDRFFRIAVRTRAENARLVEQLREIF